MQKRTTPLDQPPDGGSGSDGGGSDSSGGDGQPELLVWLRLPPEVSENDSEILTRVAASAAVEAGATGHRSCRGSCCGRAPPKQV